MKARQRRKEHQEKQIQSDRRGEPSTEALPVKKHNSGQKGQQRPKSQAKCVDPRQSIIEPLLQSFQAIQAQIKISQNALTQQEDRQLDGDLDLIEDCLHEIRTRKNNKEYQSKIQLHADFHSIIKILVRHAGPASKQEVKDLISQGDRNGLFAHIEGIFNQMNKLQSAQEQILQQVTTNSRVETCMEKLNNSRKKEFQQIERQQHNEYQRLRQQQMALQNAEQLQRRQAEELARRHAQEVARFEARQNEHKKEQENQRRIAHLKAMQLQKLLSQECLRWRLRFMFIVQNFGYVVRSAVSESLQERVKRQSRRNKACQTKGLEVVEALPVDQQKQAEAGQIENQKNHLQGAPKMFDETQPAMHPKLKLTQKKLSFKTNCKRAEKSKTISKDKLKKPKANQNSTQLVKKCIGIESGHQTTFDMGDEAQDNAPQFGQEEKQFESAPQPTNSHELQPRTTLLDQQALDSATISENNNDDLPIEGGLQEMPDEIMEEVNKQKELNQKLLIEQLNDEANRTETEKEQSNLFGAGQMNLKNPFCIDESDVEIVEQHGLNQEMTQTVGQKVTQDCPAAVQELQKGELNYKNQAEERDCLKDRKNGCSGDELTVKPLIMDNDLQMGLQNPSKQCTIEEGKVKQTIKSLQKALLPDQNQQTYCQLDNNQPKTDKSQEDELVEQAVQNLQTVNKPYTSDISEQEEQTQLQKDPDKKEPSRSEKRKKTAQNVDKKVNKSVSKKTPNSACSAPLEADPTKSKPPTDQHVQIETSPQTKPIIEPTKHEPLIQQIKQISICPVCSKTQPLHRLVSHIQRLHPRTTQKNPNLIKMRKNPGNQQYLIEEISKMELDKEEIHIEHEVNRLAMDIYEFRNGKDKPVNIKKLAGYEFEIRTRINKNMHVPGFKKYCQ